MKGIRVLDADDAKAEHRVWCVEFDGTKYHVRSYRSFAEPNNPSVNVAPCDGSCERKLENIPDVIWNKAAEIIGPEPKK